MSSQIFIGCSYWLVTLWDGSSNPIRKLTDVFRCVYCTLIYFPTEHSIRWTELRNQAVGQCVSRGVVNQERYMGPQKTGKWEAQCWRRWYNKRTASETLSPSAPPVPSRPVPSHRQLRQRRPKPSGCRGATKHSNTPVCQWPEFRGWWFKSKYILECLARKREQWARRKENTREWKVQFASQLTPKSNVGGSSPRLANVTFRSPVSGRERYIYKETHSECQLIACSV